LSLTITSSAVCGAVTFAYDPEIVSDVVSGLNGTKNINIPNAHVIREITAYHSFDSMYKAEVFTNLARRLFDYEGGEIHCKDMIPSSDRTPYRLPIIFYDSTKNHWTDFT
jgi:hypothetical protein